MPTTRRPKGDTRGGQFAPGSRPDEQTLSTALALSQREGDAPGNPKEFFNWLAYEASVGPEVEQLAAQRMEALEAWSSFDAPRRQVTGRSDPDEMDAWKHYHQSSNQLFELLNSCLLAGGHAERYARFALRKQGLQIRRVGNSGRFFWKDRGVIPDDIGLPPTERCKVWASGDNYSGLCLRLITP